MVPTEELEEGGLSCCPLYRSCYTISQQLREKPNRPAILNDHSGGKLAHYGYACQESHENRAESDETVKTTACPCPPPARKDRFLHTCVSLRTAPITAKRHALDGA